MKIGIIVAMDKELNQLQKLFTDGSVVVQKCGIGKVNAALGAQRMINEFHPDAIISSGCAGGNGDDINVQDIVVSSQLAYHDVYCGTAIDNTTQYGQVQGLPVRFEADPWLLEKALNMGYGGTVVRGRENSSASEMGVPGNLVPPPPRTPVPPLLPTIHPGLIVTGDWFVDSREKMREIIGHFPDAKAVDMESCAIAQTCYLNKVPFISFRVISDVPLRDTNASQYHDFWDTVADNSFQMTKSFVESL